MGHPIVFDETDKGLKEVATPQTKQIEFYSCRTQIAHNMEQDNKQ